MAQLIERLGKQTMVDGKSIDLSTLVDAGTEFIEVDLGGHTIPDNDAKLARSKAKPLALEIAGQYGCDYAMLGLNTINAAERMNGFVFIATFYNKRK